MMDEFDKFSRIYLSVQFETFCAVRKYLTSISQQHIINLLHKTTRLFNQGDIKYIYAAAFMCNCW